MIKDGSEVQLHYTLAVDDQVVDSSNEAEPLSYTHGEGTLLPALEAELIGMGAGEKKTVILDPENAYGEVDPEGVQVFPREAFAELDGLEVGDMVTGEAGGNAFRALVTAMEGEQVTLDLNHPLAGKYLCFNIEIVSVA